MLDAQHILRLHDEATARWHEDKSFSCGPEVFAGLLVQQHRANYDLWHEEDKARNATAPDGKLRR